jgi:phosphatidylinositol glycan class W
MSASISPSVASIKSLKEASVTGHEGSSHPWEVLWVCCSAVSGCGAYNYVTLRYKVWSGRTLPFVIKNLIQACLIWIPMILAQSEYLYPYGTCLILMQMILTAVWITTQRDENNQIQPTSPINHQSSLKEFSPPIPKNISEKSQHLDFLTMYRSSILYLTFIAILAVDFPSLFPRRFCKTEISGYGLMDVGAGSFCISAGLVGAKRCSNQSSALSTVKPFLHTIPLVAIGIIRTVINRELEYQEHVSEYGVHWNFFFTLGVLTMIPVLFRGSNSKPSILFPLFSMILYQSALSVYQWQVFVEQAPRTIAELHSWLTEETATANNLGNFVVWLHPYQPTLVEFFLANREGILGCCGYVSMYYVGEWVGFHWLWNYKFTTIDEDAAGRNKIFSAMTAYRGLGNLSVCLWIFHLWVVYILHVPVSRRSTNLGFCSWAVAHNVGLLYALQQLEKQIQAIRDTRSDCIIPPTWDTVNRHGLIMFLIANLLTGLVNLTMPTLDMTSKGALIVVFGYICLVGLISLWVDEIQSILSERKQASAEKVPKKEQ